MLGVACQLAKLASLRQSVVAKFQTTLLSEGENGPVVCAKSSLAVSNPRLARESPRSLGQQLIISLCAMPGLADEACAVEVIHEHHVRCNSRLTQLCIGELGHMAVIENALSVSTRRIRLS